MSRTVVIPRPLAETLLELVNAVIAEWYPEAIQRNRKVYQSLLADRDELEAALKERS